MNIIAILHLLAASVFFDTAYVKIHVEFESGGVNYVQFYTPDSNFFEGFDAQNFLELRVERPVDIKIPVAGSSFIALKFNNEYGIPIAVAANDSICIKIMRQQQFNYPIYRFVFSGSNEEANSIYIDRFYPAGKNLGFFDDLPQKSTSYSDYYVKAREYIDSITSVWDSLKVRNSISPAVYDLYKADTRGLLYDVAIRRMHKVATKDSSWKGYAKWAALKTVMYHHANASNPLLLKTYVGVQVYQAYLRDILKEDDAVTDTILKKSDLGYYYYYDTAYREKAWGGMLLTLKELFPTSNSQSNLFDLDGFKRYYPKSYYFNKVQNLQDSIISEREALQVPVIISKSKYKNIKNIFDSMHCRFFFIDVWATWCKPCIEEFNHQTQLTKFLADKNVQEVLFSINDEADSTQWQNFIIKQHIPGFHVLINNLLQKQLLNILSPGKMASALFIPRYLLYDKAKKIYKINLPRPSTGHVLEGVIVDFIKNNYDLASPK